MLKNNFSKSSGLQTILAMTIASVWLINGLFCKLLNFVPRHKVIIARILGENISTLFTIIIGVLEVCMVIWILSKIKTRWCALTQIFVVAVMNIIEFFLAPDLLLFGKMNILVATVFISIVFLNEFVINKSVNILNA